MHKKHNNNKKEASEFQTTNMDTEILQKLDEVLSRLTSLGYKHLSPPHISTHIELIHKHQYIRWTPNIKALQVTQKAKTLKGTSPHLVLQSSVTNAKVMDMLLSYVQAQLKSPKLGNHL